MVGVAELFPAAPLASCARAPAAHTPHANTPASQTHILRMTPPATLTESRYVGRKPAALRQSLRFQRRNARKITTAATPSPAYICQPCSFIADTIAIKAEIASNRAALPFVSS